MKDNNWLKENYVDFLEVKKKDLQDSIKKLGEEGAMDEVNLEKVRLNVVDIFSKMFDLSKDDNAEKLKENYFGFFKKITSPWIVNKEKALEFGKEKEALIEEIKLKEVEVLKDSFNELYDQIDK